MPRIDLTGRTFGHWRADSFSHSDAYRASYWNVTCVCGSRAKVITNSLTSGNSKSCGCRGVSTETARLKWLFQDYENNAKRRKISWNLSFEEFVRMVLSDCYYCGAAPCNKSRGITTSGIDRVDSRLSYGISNAVPCCWVCNRAKGRMSGEEFVRYIKRLTEHWRNKSHCVIL